MTLRDAVHRVLRRAGGAAGMMKEQPPVILLVPLTLSTIGQTPARESDNHLLTLRTDADAGSLRKDLM